MASFPKIDRPCPYLGELDSIMDGDHCRACNCTVFDLDAMAPRERKAFLKRTESEETCVTYKIKPALAAAALAAAMGAAVPAMAQDTSVRGGRGGRPTTPATTATAPVPGVALPPPGPPRGVKATDESEIIVTAGRIAPPKPKQGAEHGKVSKDREPLSL